MDAELVNEVRDVLGEEWACRLQNEITSTLDVERVRGKIALHKARVQREDLLRQERERQRLEYESQSKNLTFRNFMPSFSWARAKHMCAPPCPCLGFPESPYAYTRVHALHPLPLQLPSCRNSCGSWATPKTTCPRRRRKPCTSLQHAQAS